MNFILFIIAILLGVIQTLVEGFVLSKIWSWYFLNISPDLPTLNIIQAIGILSFFRMLNYAISYKPSDKSFEENVSNYISGVSNLILGVYPIALLFAYLWHLLL